MSDVDPPKAETDLPVPIARTSDGLGHHNVIALGVDLEVEVNPPLGIRDR